MKQSLTLTIQTLMFALIICLTTNTNSVSIKTTTAQYSYNTAANTNNQFAQQYVNDMIIPVNSSTTQKTIKKSKKKSKSSKNKAFKNYAYVKGGIARTRYNKFKEGAEDSIYVTKKPDIGLLYFAGIGHKFTKSIRADISLQYGQLKYKGKDDELDLRQKIRLFSVSTNGYYDIPIKNSLLVYLTAGIGVGNNRTSDLNEVVENGQKWEGKNTTNFVWNLGTGITFSITKRFSLDLGYRYLDLGKARTKTSTMKDGGTPRTQKITAHQMLAALIYNF